jgi:hypothetical protein
VNNFKKVFRKKILKVVLFLAMVGTGRYGRQKNSLFTETIFGAGESQLIGRQFKPFSMQARAQHVGAAEHVFAIPTAWDWSLPPARMTRRPASRFAV